MPKGSGPKRLCLKQKKDKVHQTCPKGFGLTSRQIKAKESFQNSKAEQEVWKKFGRGSVEVQERFGQVIREEKGQIGKREKKKISSF